MGRTVSGERPRRSNACEIRISVVLGEPSDSHTAEEGGVSDRFHATLFLASKISKKRWFFSLRLVV